MPVDTDWTGAEIKACLPIALADAPLVEPAERRRLATARASSGCGPGRVDAASRLSSRGSTNLFRQGGGSPEISRDSSLN